MTFKQQMADDLAAIANAAEFDEAGEFYPGETGSNHFTVRVVRGDIRTGMSTFEQGTEHTRVCTAVLIRSELRAGILAIESTAREPRRGDRILFTDDNEPTAVWYVAAAAAVDVGGGLTVDLECDDYGNPGGRGSEEVR